ncbi:metallo-beta-lactamase class B [Algoriphagus boseongensis]|uniref:beta-lactamase n=1 Tax=Algoriphagus boseongensis TaxID=1442587 RepID=A0A4R6T6N7_9BACT|nr:subclass B1 metallo-beta-lactamase [Algoriphagus boseongensis]TDQ16628.1 metallo-beta-lactamase class B [Algoriphagus boseongensis]
MRTFCSAFFLLFLGNSFFLQAQEEKLKITQLQGDFYLYTTYSTYEGNAIPAHGLYLLTEEGAVLLDTPWDTTQFQPLLDSIWTKHQQKVKLCIATHWHSDRTAGLEYYRQQGIQTYTTELTDQLSKQNGQKRAEHMIRQDTVFQVGSYAFETFYPGEGHTKDNLVLWFGEEKILYGGCLIKGTDAKNLGYMGDANPLDYWATLQNVKEKYPNPSWIILSHSTYDQGESLDHSIDLARKLKKKTKVMKTMD